MAYSMLGIFFLVATVSAQPKSFQTYEVFWKYGENYDIYTWQSNRLYSLGDKLIFRYTPGEHNVIEVDKESYDNCVVPPSAKVLSSGEDVIDILLPGKRWFICGVGNGKHCKEGNMKLQLDIEPPMDWIYHEVGDKKGWNANVDFQAWAAGRKFDVDDIIVFYYKKKEHNVFIVDEAAYNQCIIPPKDQAHTTGHDDLRLTDPGPMWFISGVGKDCENGMKLFINVTPKDDKPVQPNLLQGGRKLVPQS